MLEHGFLRVVCEHCRAEMLVAYSCKKRGFCPSCGARRMAESARHLVGEVFGPQGAVCVALHPGWVATDMGGPSAPLTPERSAADLRALLARLGPQDNGRFLNHDGSAIPW